MSILIGAMAALLAWQTGAPPLSAFILGAALALALDFALAVKTDRL